MGSADRRRGGPPGAARWIGHRIHQRPRVGMLRIGPERRVVGALDDPPRYITSTRSAEIAHHRQVVADEEIGEAQSFFISTSRLRICAWMERSRAETGSSQTIRSGLSDQRAGDADALALAAGEFMRIAVRWHRRGKPTLSMRSRRPSARRSSRSPHALMDAQRRGEDLADLVPRIEARRTDPEKSSGCDLRTSRALAGRARVMSSPLNLDAACGRSTSRSRVLPRVDLPQPDFAHQPDRLPALDARSTPSTAAQQRRRGSGSGS